MKKIFISLLLIGYIMIGYNIVNATFDGCDKTVYTGIRYGYSTILSDTFQAGNSDKKILGVDINFYEQEDFNQHNPDFSPDSDLKMGFTADIIKQQGIVKAGQNMKFLQATGYNGGKYSIRKVPQLGRNNQNFGIQYIITSAPTSNLNNKKVHKECMYYEISRCGDGIKDNDWRGRCVVKNGITTCDDPEQCDPNAPESTWDPHTSNQFCNQNCKLETKTQPKPTCKTVTTEYNGENFPKDKIKQLCGDRPNNTYGLYITGAKKDEANHKWTWQCRLTWNGGEALSDVCEARYEYCGDGKITNGESCDPANSDWKNRKDGKSCSNSCTVIEPNAPVCSSVYNNHTQYTNNSEHWLNKDKKDLCSEGKVINFNVSSGTPRTYTWDCKNGDKVTDPGCTATQQRCGDGIRQSDYEDCDPNDSSRNGRENGTCSASCEFIPNQDPYCGSEHNTTKYNTNFPTARLNEKSDNLCVNGNVSDFYFDSTKGTYVWKCNGKSGTTPASCSAKDLRCGDGIKQANYEQCDGNNGVGKGEICDESCHIKKVAINIHKSFKSATWDGSKWNVVWTITGSSVNQPAGSTLTLVDTFPANYSYESNDKNYPYSNGEFTKIPVNTDFSFDITTTTDKIHATAGENKICIKNQEKEICDKAETPALKIEKVAKTKKSDITKIGDTVEWNIKVTSLKNSVTNFDITDTIPDSLTFDSVSISPSTLKISNKGDDKNLNLHVDGTLTQGSSATITVKTKLAQAVSEVKNSACIEGTTPLCDTGTVETDLKAYPWIKKVFLVNGNEQKELKNLHKGDKVEYKITFGNTGDKIAKVKFEDFQPANLGERKITSATDRNGNSVDLNKTIELKKDEIITVLAEGVVTKYNYKSDSDRTNTGKITKLNDDGSIPSTCKKDECYFEDRVRYTVDMKPYFWIEKGILVNGVLYTGTAAQNLDFKGGDHITFQVRFGNSGDVDAENVKFDDPAVLNYLKSDSIKGTLTLNRETRYGTTFTDLTLYEGEGNEGVFILEGEFVPDNKDGTKSAARAFARNQACVGLKDQWDVKDPFKAACANVGFKPHYPSLIVSKTLETSGDIHTGDIVKFRIRVTNNGDTDLEGLEVIDTLPEGLVYEGQERTNGYPNGDAKSEEKKSTDTAKFANTGKTIKKSLTYTGRIDLDNLTLKSNESFEVESITLGLHGISLDNIVSVTLGGKKLEYDGNSQFVFDFTTVGDNGIRCNDLVNKEKSLNLSVELKEGDRNDPLYFTLDEVKGTKSFETGITSQKVEFIKERAYFIGGETGVSITVPSVTVDTLSFDLTDAAYTLNNFYLKREGTLPLDNIKKISINGYEVDKKQLTVGLPTIANITNDKKINIDVELTGFVPDQSTLWFTVQTFDGGRLTDYPKVGDKTRVVTFNEREEDKESVTFSGGNEKWDIFTKKERLIDTLTFKINWDLPLKTLSLKQNGSLEVGKINKVTIGGKTATGENGIFTVNDLTVSKDKPTLDVVVETSDDIESGKTLYFILETLDNGRKIATGVTSKQITFEEIPEYAKFEGEGGNVEVGVLSTGVVLDTLKFTLNDTLPVKNITLIQTGSLSGNIESMTFGETPMICENKECKVSFGEKSINSGDTLTLAIQFKGEANSGDTLGFILSEINERRHIATGSETKTLYFVENPESVAFVNGKDITTLLSITTSESNIDQLLFNLSKSLNLTHVALEKLGTVETGAIAKVFIGDTTNAKELTRNGEKYEWIDAMHGITIESGMSLPVTVQFVNGALKTDTKLSFKLVGMDEARHLELGTVSKELYFTDDLKSTKAVSIEGILHDDIFSEPNILVDTLEVFFNKQIGDKETVTMKKLTLSCTGDVKANQISSLTLSKDGGIIYTPTKSNGKFIFDKEIPLSTADLFKLSGVVEGLQTGNTVQFVIEEFAVTNPEIATVIATKTTRLLKYNSAFLTLKAEHETDVVPAKKIDKKYELDRILPTLGGKNSLTISELTLTMSGTIAKDDIENVYLADITGAYLDNTYSFKNIKVTDKNKPLPLKIILKNEPENGSGISFVLTSFSVEDGDSVDTSIEEPKETSTLLFNNPSMKVKVENPSHELDGKDFTFSTVVVTAKGVDPNDYKIKGEMELRLTGDMTAKQITGLSLYFPSQGATIQGKVEGNRAIFDFANKTVHPTDFIIKGTLTGSLKNLDGKTLGFIIKGFRVDRVDGTTPEVKSVDVIDNDTTDILTYETSKVIMTAHSGEITTKDKTVLLDTLDITSSNVNNSKLSSVVLTWAGKISPAKVKLHTNDTPAFTEATREYAFNFAEPISLQSVTSLPLEVTLPEGVNNGDKLQFSIKDFTLTDSNIATGITEPLTKVLIFNDPFVTIKGFEGEKEIQGQDFVLSGFTVGYNGAQDINLKELTLILSGIDVTHIDTTDGNDNDRLKLQYNGHTIKGVNEKGTKKFKFAFNELEGKVTNPGGIVFMVKGKLQNLTKLADGSKFNFIITGVKANIDEGEIKVQYDPIDHSQTGVYKKHIITINVKNLEDGTFKTLENLKIDSLTFDGLKDGEDYSITSLSLIPQGKLLGAITQVKIAGNTELVKKDGKYVLSNSAITFRKGNELPITVTFDPTKVHNGDSLSFEVVEKDFGVSPAATYKFTPEDKKTRTITFSNPIITLEGAGKGTPEKKTKKSEVELGNLTFTLNGLENNEAMISEIILTLSGKNFKPENLTAMKLTTPAGDLQMNGKFEKNKLHFTAKDTKGITIKTDQKFVVKVTLTGNIVDEAELFFEVTDFKVVQPDSSSLTKNSLNTTKSITFVNPTIFLEGNNSSSVTIDGNSYEYELMTVKVQEVKEPKISKIMLKKTGTMNSGNIDNLIIEGITGTYEKGDKYIFDFGTEGLKVTEGKKLKLNIQFTGEAESLKDKKIGFSIESAEGNDTIKITTKETETLIHTAAGSNACYQGPLKKGYFSGFVEDGKQLRWYDFIGVLQAGDSIDLVIKTKVNATSTNYVLARAQDLTASAEKTVTIKDRPKLSCTVSPSSKSLIYYDSKSQTVKVTCETSNGESAKMKLDCGNGDTVTDTRRSITHTCEYKKSDFTLKNGKTDEYEPISVTCKVSYDSQEGQCEGEVKREEDSLPICGDGKTNWQETCDCGNGEKSCELSVATINPRAKFDERNKDHLQCVNCKINCDDGSCPVPEAACFDINAGSISINTGEILPFYWDIKKIKNGDNEKSYIFSGKDNARSVYKNTAGEDCSDLGTNGTILLNSMLCTFNIYGGKYGEEKDNHVIYSREMPCFDSVKKSNNTTEEIQDKPLIQAYLKWLQNSNIPDGNKGGSAITSWDVEETDYKFAPTLSYISGFGNGKISEEDFPQKDSFISIVEGGKAFKYFGEYKLSLSSLKYLQCIDNKWTQIMQDDSVCQNNISVTKPYLVTKTPSGIGSNVKDVLNKFYFMNGDTFAKNLTNLVAANDFDSNYFQSQYTTFKNRYQQLAIKVSDENSIEESKVPQKDIFFVTGDMVISGYTIAYDISKSEGEAPFHKDIKTPVTIVQTNGDTKIKGNINHNIMLLSEGKIIFDGTGNCDDAQTVNGIFYASGGFERINTHMNNDLNNPERCIGGGLHIKGALIGSGISNLVNSGRSQLNTWFYGEMRNDVKDRREGIFSGAAVLIEYSPTVSAAGSMPPGAEDFTSTLSIYKR